MFTCAPAMFYKPTIAIPVPPGGAFTEGDVLGLNFAYQGQPFLYVTVAEPTAGLDIAFQAQPFVA